MAGCSGTPLAKKLGIKPGGLRIVLVAAPDRFERLLEGLPADATVRRDLRGKAPIDVAVLFTKTRSELETRFGPLAAKLDDAGGLWVAWPKKASGVQTDVTEEFVRRFGLDAGLVDNKICAIDEVWSGLRFVYRKEDRPKRRA